MRHCEIDVGTVLKLGEVLISLILSVYYCFSTTFCCFQLSSGEVSLVGWNYISKQ